MRIARTSKRLGFTVTELLIVIAIIAVLASLLLPALASAKASAVSANCKSNLRQLALMMRMYVDDHQVYPLWQPAGRFGARVSWLQAIGARTYEFEVTPQRGHFSRSIARCPNGPQDDIDEDIRPSYGYNAFDGTPRFIVASDPPFGRGLGGVLKDGLGPTWVHVPEAAVLNPADTYAIGDGFISTDKGRIAYGSGAIGRNMEFASSVPAEYINDGENAATRRHRGKLNVALCDGHVESVSIRNLLLNNESVWKRRWHNQNIP